MKRRLIILLVLVGVLAALAIALRYTWREDHQSATISATHFTLTNGLEVVILPNARIPAVAHILYVRAGAADDPKGKTGLAHYLEHLLFTGTKQHPEGAYERFVVAAGGKQNAFTTRDYTAYYTLIAKEQLDAVMQFEVDRLQNLTLDPARVARELNVITEERHSRVETNPAALFNEQLSAITFLNHPYRQPTIGWPRDMAQLTADDAIQYFKTHYVPSNMVLLIAGDVTPDAVRSRVERHYGVLRAAKKPTRFWPEEPEHRLAITASMADEKVREPRLIRQYLAPSIGTADAAQTIPTALLAHLIGGGETSVLHRRLVLEQKLATAVVASYDELSHGPALLRIVATPAADVSLPKLKQALDAVLDEVRAAPPSPQDLARAKTGFVASVVFAQDGLLPLAQLVGELYMVGKDYAYFNQWPEAVKAATAESVQQAAQSVLKTDARITGYLLPKETRDVP